jgi:hypothetical protein
VKERARGKNGRPMKRLSSQAMTIRPLVLFWDEERVRSTSPSLAYHLDTDMT